MRTHAHPDPYHDPETLRSFYYSTEERLDIRRRTWEQYGENPQPFSQWILSELPELRRPEVRWLDIGCGQGHLAQTVLQTNASAQFEGIDLSPAMVTTSQNRLREFPRAHVKEANAENLPFSSESFDTVTAIHVFHHLEDPRPTLREIRRTLTAEGVAFLTVAQTHLHEGLNRVHYETIRRLGLPSFLLQSDSYLPQNHERLLKTIPQESFHLACATYQNSLRFTSSAPAMAYYTSAMMYRNTEGPGDPRVTQEQWCALRLAVEKAIQQEIETVGVFRSPGDVCGYRLTL